MEDRFCSLSLAKKLKEAGCELESEKVYSKFNITNTISEYQLCNSWQAKKMEDKYPAFDIMWDIAIVHVKEFFNTKVSEGGKPEGYYGSIILGYLLQGKKQEAEDYIWHKTVFRVKNKVEE